jgi:hypothetical protein
MKQVHSIGLQILDHGNILQHHHGLATWNVKRVGLRTPPVNQSRQRGRVHHQQTASDEPSKRQEPRTLYEWHVPLVPHQGVVHADPEWGQSLWNTTIVQKY